ncbi:cytochrome P450 [Actinoplanes sp. NPDC051470]|uniref:cytochrome P450 n=1 Tax=Actinoplanes sp. NPDC051470 TaxID=3157224 RepID=UPI00341C2C47
MTATPRVPIPRAYFDRAGHSPFDPPAVLGRLGELSPVSRVNLLDGSEAYVVTGIDEGRQVLTDPRFSADRFMHRSSLRPNPRDPYGAGAGLFAAMDPPLHTRYRRLLTGAFTVRRVGKLEPAIRDIAATLIDRMLARGNSGDLVTDFALPLPSLVICELLGVAHADQATFQSFAAEMARLDTSPERAAQLGAEFDELLSRSIEHKRANLGDDLLSGLISSDADPALTNIELVNIARQLLVAGHETTSNMLALGMFALLSHPDQLDFLRTHPGHWPAAVEELLRYLSIAQLSVVRVTTHEVPLGETTLPAGAAVIVAVSQANRDAGTWTAPQDLRVDRPRCPHLAFGFGVHQCLGQQLARLELIVGYAALLDRLPGLRLAVAAHEVPLRTDMTIFGVHALPVRWS